MNEEIPDNVIPIDYLKKKRYLKSEGKTLEEAILALDRTIKLLLDHYRLRPINNLLNEVDAAKKRLEGWLVRNKKELEENEKKKPEIL